MNTSIWRDFEICFSVPLKILQYSQESTCIGACAFIKKNLQHMYFPVKFASKICKIFKNTDFLQNADGGFFCLEGQIPWLANIMNKMLHNLNA